jgi:tripartite ATP-independent transporter DctP family solute receptor
MSRNLSLFAVGAAVVVLLGTTVFALVTRTRRQARNPANKIYLKLAHGLDEKHPVHAGMVEMARLARERSQGKVIIDILPNGQLGNETDCIEYLQSGALAMTKVSAGPLESFLPEMAVFSVPYVFRSEEHCWKVLDGAIGDRLLLAGKDRDLIGLCYYDAGTRNFYTTDTAIEHPDDLQGLKIRVMKSKTSMDMVDALGGAPTPIPWGELYTALQTRIVDGAENNLLSFYTNRHYEVCKHFSYDEHTMIPDVLLISKPIWDSLSPEVQKLLRQCARDSSVYQRHLWAQKTREAEEMVKKEGVTIHHPNKTPFENKVQEMHRQLADTVVGKLIQEIRNESQP